MCQARWGSCEEGLLLSFFDWRRRPQNLWVECLAPLLSLASWHHQAALCWPNVLARLPWAPSCEDGASSLPRDRRIDTSTASRVYPQFRNERATRKLSFRKSQKYSFSTELVARLIHRSKKDRKFICRWRRRPKSRRKQRWRPTLSWEATKRFGNLSAWNAFIFYNQLRRRLRKVPRDNMPSNWASSLQGWFSLQDGELWATWARRKINTETLPISFWIEIHHL